MKKPARSLSGVSVVAVMSSPAPCPHGRCSYCPGGQETPQSYTGKEPAGLRGAMYGYDSFSQTRSRLDALKRNGHPLDKIEAIVMGGTFMARDKGYRQKFVKGVFDGLNGHIAGNIAGAMAINEGAESRCVGLTIETRPDYAEPEEMLKLGATRVELGLQTVHDDVLKGVKRGCTVEDCVKATEKLKDSGFKICYHIMPGLPGSDFQRDLETFRTIFGDEKFKPDMLKIYPALVIKGTELYEDWVDGTYVPMPLDEVVELLARAKGFAPPWIRIQRLDRDIPIKCIEAGVKKSNLRQLVKERMGELGLKCECIRCREAGLRGRDTGKPELVVRRYRASGGREIFFSYELEDGTLIGFLRLRLRGKAMVRELHIYGKEVPIGERGEGWQHRGYGKYLLKAAEEEAAAKGFGCLYVLSGVGAKEYYRKLGYEKEGYYVKKDVRAG